MPTLPQAAANIGISAIAMLAMLAAADGAAADATATKSAQSADQTQLGEKWVRLLEDKDGAPTAMQTAIVRYVPAGEVREGRDPREYDRYVDLVGAVHIGDRAYYRLLNQRFRGYDRVLYELVAPEGTVVPKGRGTSNSNPLGALQNGMKSMLEVEHQLERIDYTQRNFVHADLSPEEFLEAMSDRDDSFLKMYFRMLGAALAQQSQQSTTGQSSDLDFLSALLSDDRPRQLKIAMAKQFENVESLMVGFSGAGGSTLITDRNQRALDVLEKEWSAGEDQIAIFYGAGHMSEMHKQMAEQMDMQPVHVEWIDAWDLRP